jgi:hypothetical protein
MERKPVQNSSVRYLPSLKLSIFGSSFPTFHPLTFPHFAAPGNVIGQNWTLSASIDGLYV